MIGVKIVNRHTGTVVWENTAIDSLVSADLYGADLRGADLRGADLRGANLRGADLGGADLGNYKRDEATGYAKLKQ